MITSSPTSPMTAIPVLRRKPRRRSRARGPAVRRGRREARHATDEGGADIGAATGREQPGLGSEVLVDPVEPLRSQRRAGRSERAETREVTTRRGLDALLDRRGDEACTGPEAGHARALGQVPEDVHVGMTRAAVVEHDRGRGQQAGDEEVPHHPAGRGEPEDAVAVLGVDVEVELLEMLDQDSALALDDRFRQSSRAGGVQHPERVIEGDPLEGRIGSLAEVGQLRPKNRFGERRSGPDRPSGRAARSSCGARASLPAARRQGSVRSKSRPL